MQEHLLLSATVSEPFASLAACFVVLNRRSTFEYRYRYQVADNDSSPLAHSLLFQALTAVQQQTLTQKAVQQP